MRNLKWKIVCPYCNKEVSKADIDFIDKRICLDCRIKDKNKPWKKGWEQKHY